MHRRMLTTLATKDGIYIDDNRTKKLLLELVDLLGLRVEETIKLRYTNASLSDEPEEWLDVRLVPKED